jgi:hypothetical protein
MLAGFEIACRDPVMWLGHVLVSIHMMIHIAVGDAFTSGIRRPFNRQLWKFHYVTSRLAC